MTSPANYGREQIAVHANFRGMFGLRILDNGSTDSVGLTVLETVIQALPFYVV